MRAEFTTKFEQLIARIEERDKEVVNKIENVIKVQEALYKMNDMIGAALHDQKDSTASVLKRLVDSLRTEGTSVSSLASEVLLQSPSPLEQGEKELEVSSEGKADVGVAEAPVEEPIASLKENEEKVSEEAVANFNMQEFLDAEPEAVAVTEGGLEVPSEDKVEANDQVASSEGIEGKAPESAGGGIRLISIFKGFWMNWKIFLLKMIRKLKSDDAGLTDFYF